MTKIPEGMKPWNGGYGPPEDWDGGPVMRSNGRINATTECSSQWHNRDEERDQNYKPIFAYTPKQQPVDWTKPLVAVHPDGRRVEVDLIRDEPDEDGDHEITKGLWDNDAVSSYFNNEGIPHTERLGNRWRIENREQPPAYPEGMTPERTAEALDILRKVANRKAWDAIDDEAQAFMAKVEPVSALEAVVFDALDSVPWGYGGDTKGLAKLLAPELVKRGMELAEAKQ